MTPLFYPTRWPFPWMRNARAFRRNVTLWLASVMCLLPMLCTVACADTPLHNAQALPFTLVQPITQLAPLSLSDAEQQWLQQHAGALRVGMPLSDYEPLDIAVDRNRYQGVSADYLGLIGSRLGTTVQIHGFARREDAIEALQRGDIDVLTSANAYERSFPGLSFTTPYLVDRPVLLQRSIADPTGEQGRPAPDSTLKGPPAAKDALEKQRIAVLEGYATIAAMQHAYPAAQIVLAPSLNSALEALRQGDLSAVVGNEVVLRSYMALRPYVHLAIVADSPIQPSGFSFAMRSADEPLRMLFDRALESLQGSLQREILGRWTSGLGSGITRRPVQLDADEHAWVAGNPKVRVVATEYPPYLYRDRHGRWVGLNADLLDALAQMTGLQFEYLPARSIGQSLAMLGNGQAQMNTTLSETPERRRFLEFTHSYGGQSWVFVSRRDGVAFDSLEEMAGRVLALPAQHALEDLIRREYPQIRLERFATAEQARRAVIRGEADVTIDSEVGAYRAVSRDEDAGLVVGRSLDGAWSPDRFSVSIHQPQLLRILNKGLEAFPVAELRAIRLKWLGSPMPEVPVWQRIAPWVYWGAAVIGLVALVSLLWNGRLRVQIAQRQRAERALNDQLAFQKALLDGIPIPVYVRDLEGRLLSCNRSYEESFATRLERIKGLQLPEVGIIAPQDAHRLHADYIKQLDNPQPMFVDRHIELAGKRIDAYQWTVPFYRADGQLQGLLGGWIDITERKRLEAELIDARQAAEEASLAKSSFLATMSHDIRTPLSAIVGLLELERQQAREQGRDLTQGLDVAFRCAHELLELVGDSLDLARIEAGRLELHLGKLALGPFFEGVTELFVAQAQGKGIELKLQFGDNLHGEYLADALRLRQILHNLLGNALKFTHHGTVSLTVQGHRQDNALHLQVRIEDTGIGIETAQQAQLFQPYVQSSNSEAQGYGGTGLGLSICQQLVALMGGTLRLDSAPGQGTRVMIELRLKAVDEPPSRQPLDTASPAVTTSSRCLHVLIADDLSSNRLVLCRQLEFLGHQVRAVNDGEAALQAWETGGFAVLITDCNMPGISGYELARRIRELERAQGSARLPIIGYTANVMNDERERCEAAGMDLWLPKPLSLDALAQALEALAQPRQFNPQTLSELTHADPRLMQRMLTELDKNLADEHDALEHALESPDWPAISLSLHRLNGLCALIDAMPLARACSVMARVVADQDIARADEAWAALQGAVRHLRTEVVRTLEAPSLRP
jgi:two-component system sensor histidine kinase EvgS